MEIMGGKYRKSDFEAMHRLMHTPHISRILSSSVVGIAGAGGLGSNAAVMLARAGVGKLVIADFDKVEFSNLNRQYYTLKDIGKYKVEALSEELKLINPYLQVETHIQRIGSGNCYNLFKDVDVLIEAVDVSEIKRVIIESILSKTDCITVVAGSGLAGYGRNNEIHEEEIAHGRLVVIGDGKSEVGEGIPLLAPRVTVVAGMQANSAVEILLRKKTKIRGTK